ncbi:MAG: hypothetical protein RH917_19020 [Lacipirellulaceae bacterium]
MMINRCCFLAIALAAAISSNRLFAITTSQGQSWDYQPDAWARGSDANTAYFGWDDFEIGGNAVLGFGRVLDDTTPDLGTAVPNVRIYQGNDGANDPSPTTYGHRSGSGNFYTGFAIGPPPHNNQLDDTITGIAPASGTDGCTTLVLQVIGQTAGGMATTGAAIEDLFFDLPGWTKQKDLYGLEANGSGVYWQEWTAPGANLPFSIEMTSDVGTADIAIDAFQVDTYWTPGASPAINSIGSIGVPELSSFVLVSLMGIGVLHARRCRN